MVAPSPAPPQPGLSFAEFRLLGTFIGESTMPPDPLVRTYRMVWVTDGDADQSGTPTTPRILLGQASAFSWPEGLSIVSELVFTFQNIAGSPMPDQWPQTVTTNAEAFVFQLWRYVLNETLPPALRESAAEVLVRSVLCAPDADAVPIGKRLPDTLRQALDFLTDTTGKRPMTRVSLGHLAKISGVSSHHLCRLFRRHLDLSPLFVHRILRMAHARRLLLESDSSIEEVARKLGYPSLNNFRHHFRSVYGIVPSSLRKEVPPGKSRRSATGLAATHPLSRYLSELNWVAPAASSSS
jgi:AraC-like DNA-binding protein